MSLQIYDIAVDDFREATQADIDGLQEVANAYAAIRKTLDTTHAGMMAKIAKIRSEHGLPT